MNPLIIILGTAVIVAPCFYILGAIMAASKDADDYVTGWLACSEYGDEQRDEIAAAHSRASDALTTKNERIERALECVTENSAHVGKKMAAILRGER